jgi:hypothetical protein
MSFWTGLNRVDNPTTENYRWYLLNVAYVRDTGYRGEGGLQEGGLQEAPATTAIDTNCVGWIFDNGRPQGLTKVSCANVDNLVEGYICEYDYIPR